METQELNSRYIDKQRLEQLLRTLFGNTYEVEVSTSRRPNATQRRLCMLKHYGAGSGRVLCRLGSPQVDQSIRLCNPSTQSGHGILRM